MDNECIVCGGNADLSSLGLVRVAAFYHCHGLACDAKHHMICQICSSISIKSINFEKMKVSDAFITNSRLQQLLESFRMVRGLPLENLSNDELCTLTGLTYDQLKSISQVSEVHITHVARIFEYCRLGVGQRAVGTISGVDQISRSLNKYLQKISDTMSEKHLRRSRKEILDNIPKFLKVLIPDIFGLFDGTYHEVEKSTDFMVQLKTFSMQKSYNLIKTLSLMTADAKWWDLLGIFFADADHSDQFMWEHAVDNDLANVSEVIDIDKDVFVVDRYFIFILYFKYSISKSHFRGLNRVSQGKGNLATPGGVVAGGPKQMSAFDADRCLLSLKSVIKFYSNI